MARRKPHAEMAQELAGFVGKSCPGATVEVAHSPRWQRTCLTFRWAGFGGLLPEERFRIVAHLIPAAYYEAHCRGAVWLELADGESIDDYLKLPRSEDIESKLPQVWAFLGEVNFFAALEDELVRMPVDQCPNDLSISKRVLAAKQASAGQARDAVLAFMRHQAYTDWEVLRQVCPLVGPSANPKGKSVRNTSSKSTSSESTSSESKSTPVKAKRK